MQQQKYINLNGQRYLVSQILGSGSQGAVYKAKPVQGDKEVAIKIQNSITFNEFKLLEELYQNPKDNIIGIKAVQREQNGQINIVMELADQELFQYIESNDEYKTLTKDQKNQMFKQMVMSVKQLHELGYYHRDLKPENFVVFKKDKFRFVKTKLIDLGLVKQHQQNLMQTKNIGTPYYMAPEIFDYQANYNDKVDSWALGCIWFEILTRETFIQGNSQDQLFQQIKGITQNKIEQRIKQFYDNKTLNEYERHLIAQLIKCDQKDRLTVKGLADYFKQYQDYEDMVWKIGDMVWKAPDTDQEQKYLDGNGSGSLVKDWSLQQGWAEQNKNVKIYIYPEMSQDEFQQLEKLKRNSRQQLIEIKAIFKQFNGSIALITELANQKLLDQNPKVNELINQLQKTKPNPQQQLVPIQNLRNDNSQQQKPIQIFNVAAFPSQPMKNVPFQNQQPVQLNQAQFNAPNNIQQNNQIPFTVNNGLQQQNKFQGNTTNNFSFQQNQGNQIKNQQQQNQYQYLNQNNSFLQQNQFQQQKQLQQLNSNPSFQQQNQFQQFNQNDNFQQQQQLQNSSLQQEIETQEKGIREQLEELEQKSIQDQQKLQQFEFEKQQLQNTLQEKDIKIQELEKQQLIVQEIERQNQQEQFKKQQDAEKKRRAEEDQQKQKQEEDERKQLEEEEKQRKEDERKKEEQRIISLKETEEKKQQELKEKEQQFNETKQRTMRLIQDCQEQVEKFQQNLEERKVEQNGIKTDEAKQYENLIQQFVENNKKRLKIITDEIIRLQELNDFSDLESVKQAKQLEMKYQEEYLKINRQLIDEQNQLAIQKKKIDEKQVQLEKQQKEQQQQLHQLQQIKQQIFEVVQQINQQNQKYSYNFQNLIANAQSIESQEYYISNAKEINQLFEIIQKSIQINQKNNQNAFQNQELTVQIYQSEQLLKQFQKNNRELDELIKKLDALIKKLMNDIQNRKSKIAEQFEQFQEEALVYTVNLIQHKKYQKKNLILIEKMEKSNQDLQCQLQNLKQILKSENLIGYVDQLRQIDIVTFKLQEIENLDIKLIQYQEEQSKIEEMQQNLQKVKQQVSDKQNQWQKEFYVLFLQFKEYSDAETQSQLEQLKQNCQELLSEFDQSFKSLNNQGDQQTVEKLKYYEQEYQKLIQNYTKKIDEKVLMVQNLFQKLNKIKIIKETKLIKYDEFKSEIIQIKKFLRDLDFHSNFEVYPQILKFRNENQIRLDLILGENYQQPQSLENLKQNIPQCYQLYEKNKQVYSKLTKQQNNNFNKYSEFKQQLDKFQQESEISMNQLKVFHNFVLQYYDLVKYKGEIKEYEYICQAWQGCQEILKFINDLEERAINQYQQCENNQSVTENFLLTMDENLKGLKQKKQYLYNIDSQLIQKFNIELQNNLHSFSIEILLTLLIQNYQIEGYLSRLISKASDKGRNKEQLPNGKYDPQKVKACQIEFKRLLIGKKYTNWDAKELQDKQAQIEVQEQNLNILINEIITKNRVKLRIWIKNQEVIKQILYLSPYQQVCQVKLFEMVLEQKSKDEQKNSEQKKVF